MSISVFQLKPTRIIGLLNLLQCLVAVLLLAFALPPTLAKLIGLSSTTFQATGDSGTSIGYHWLFLEGTLLSLISFCTFIAIYLRQSFFITLAAWGLCNICLGFYLLNITPTWLPLEKYTQSPYLLSLLLGSYVLLCHRVLQLVLINTYNERLFNYSAYAVTALFLSAIFLPQSGFELLLGLATPLLLALAIYLFFQKIALERTGLVLWQVIALSILCASFISSLLGFLPFQFALLTHFNAFLFLALCNVAMLLGTLDYIYKLNHEVKELSTGYQSTPFPVLKIDEDGYILLSNVAFKKLCDTQNVMNPENWDDVFPSQNWRHVARRSKFGKHTEIELSDGPLHTSITLLSLHASAVDDGYIVILQDITPYMKTLERLKVMANNDPITQVLNQRGLEKALNYTLNNLNQHQPCYLGFLSVNHVNHVNRTYGHPAGDALLQEVSQRISSILGDKHSFGRIGSDDFVFILEKTTAEEAKEIATNIANALNHSPINTLSRDYNLNVSLGLIEMGDDLTVQSALRTAQSASAEARYQEQSFVLYEHNSLEMQYRAEELQLFEHLENGITQGLHIMMQPLLNLSSPTKSFNLEALLRVKRTNGEPIPLNTFITAAEDNGTICIIDKWVLVTTLDWLQTNYQQLQHVDQVNINLSGYSLNNEKFIQDFFVILDKYRPLMHKLCIEITEGVALQSLHHIREFMKNLQRKGVSIALDDFGAGYTSFSYLSQLPANMIKIDGALIENMLAKRSQVAIVRTIIELAHNLGMQSVAEWVKDEETLIVLRKMGVDFVQGFAIAAPMEPERIIQAGGIVDLMVNPAIIPKIKQTKPIKRAPPIAG